MSRLIKGFFLFLLFIATPFITAKISSFLIQSQPDNFVYGEALRQKALQAGFKPNPSTKEELFKLENSPSHPLSETKIALGKTLFFDPLLSKDGSISCASCHILQEGGDDNRPTAIGYHNQPNPHHLNSPTVLNAALQKFQFWDGRAKSVEEQAAGPIQAPFEMAMTKKEVLHRVMNNPFYKEAFKKKLWTSHHFRKDHESDRSIRTHTFDSRSV